MKSIFLDVGAHKGETIYKIKNIPFDRVVAFEPSVRCHDELCRVAGRYGALVKPFGLLDRDIMLPLHWSGSPAASLYQDKMTIEDLVEGGSLDPELCMFRQASIWLSKSIAPDEQVFMKLNVEGAEIDILRDIWENWPRAPELRIALDWDCQKIRRLRKKRAALLADHPTVADAIVCDDWSEKSANVLSAWRREVQRED